MTENGTFIINGTERVVVSQLHRSPGRLLRPRQGQDPLVAASCSTTRASSRTAARGSTSSSTTRTSSTSASTAAASCTRRCCCAPSATATRKKTSTSDSERPQLLLRHRDHLRRAARASTRRTVEPRPAPGPARHARHQRPQDAARSSSRRTASSPRAPSRSWRRPRSKSLPVEPEEVVGKVAAEDVVDEATGEVLLECNEEVTEAKLEELREREHRRVQGPLHRQPERRLPYLRDTLHRRTRSQTPGRGDHGDLPAPAPGRSADARRRRSTLFDNLFFNPERYDLSKVGRLKLNYKFEHRRAARQHRPHQARHPRGGPLPHRAQERPAARSTTSTTSATAACARSASCWRTSTASAWSAWSAPSRSA